MLLRKLASLLRKDDQGAALAAVMSLMLLGALLSVLILASVVASLASTTATRATVQSEASAQGGVDVALASITSGNCVSSYTSATAPKYLDLGVPHVVGPVHENHVDRNSGEPRSGHNDSRKH